MKIIIGFGLVLLGVFTGAVLAFAVIYGYLTHTGAKSSYSAWCGLSQANVCQDNSVLAVGDNYGEQKTAHISTFEPKVSDAYYQYGRGDLQGSYNE